MMPLLAELKKKDRAMRVLQRCRPNGAKERVTSGFMLWRVLLRSEAPEARHLCSQTLPEHFSSPVRGDIEVRRQSEFYNDAAPGGAKEKTLGDAILQRCRP